MAHKNEPFLYLKSCNKLYTSDGISYLGDTLISKMNAAKANSGVQACKKAEVDYSESNNSVYANKGYNPKPGERTFKGYVEQNVDSNAELSLYTDSNQFSNTSKNLPIEGGAFKRFGVDEHAGISPHVHYETYRNIDPNNSNIIRGGLKNNPVRYLNAKDVKQLYDYLENGKYHK